ncbi:membrane hypothetical protein [Xenorhabdus cabanillasii JM26]|uniref:Amino acid permease/ SLC12A domain-containing protein n=1 Tax=Xenorhabdus cabanillasii JM26 TaxID=1427517 RepID=W1JBK9_9GAMM|nr:amino acid transporter [Xenorhabdus cabanillasii JM26]CDL86890.1 membrane hypothetical protein [Xenorhabdus cabanillasii JM26]
MTNTVKTPVEQPTGAQKLHRGLEKRHVQLIAIGGAIGTGLFMGTGKTIAVSGNSIILTYLLIGFFAFMVMRAMGELLLTKLDYRTFADFVADYLGEKASYFLGWTYWMSWVVSCIADVVVSVRHLTEPEVFLPNGVIGFLAGFQIAIFSFTGP